MEPEESEKIYKDATLDEYIIKALSKKVSKLAKEEKKHGPSAAAAASSGTHDKGGALDLSGSKIVGTSEYTDWTITSDGVDITDKFNAAYFKVEGPYEKKVLNILTLDRTESINNTTFNLTFKILNGSEKTATMILLPTADLTEGELAFTLCEDFTNVILNSHATFDANRVRASVASFLESAMDQKIFPNNKWKDLGYVSDHKLNGVHTSSLQPQLTAYQLVNMNIQWSTGGTNQLQDLASQLPGVQIQVGYPCACGMAPKRNSLINIIMHLNDVEKWDRERIADWLDELHDSGEVNIEFETPDADD